MDQLKETGILVIGVEVDGVVHQNFTMRPRLVRDAVTALEDPKAQGNDAYRGVALLAQQLESLGTLAKEQITTDLLLDMYDVDMEVIVNANTALEKRLASFRKPADGQAAAPAGDVATEGGSAVGSSG